MFLDLFIFPEKELHILIIEVLCSYHCESHSLMKKYIISQVRLKYHWSIATEVLYIFPEIKHI